MLDDRTSAGEADLHPFAGEFIWNHHNNRFGWEALLGVPPGSEKVSPYAAPARAESLAGLPPTFISTGALDLFVDEDVAYAQRLMRAGVPTELHVYPGAFHAFDFAPDADVSKRARRDSPGGSGLRAGCRSGLTIQIGLATTCQIGTMHFYARSQGGGGDPWIQGRMRRLAATTSSCRRR